MSRQPTTKGDHYESRLARNLRKLITHQSGGVFNVLAWCDAHPPLDQSTIRKLAVGERGGSLAMLQSIEDATRYQAWQLLHPDFDPRRMPPMADPKAMRIAAIYASITVPILKKKAEAVMEQFAADQPDPPAAGTIPEPLKSQ